jgi:beta-phosphoglucomutase
MKNFTAIFDMDGTLVDNTPYHYKSWQAFYKKHGLGDISVETYKKSISGVPIIETMRQLFPDTDEDTLKKYREEKETVYHELYAPFLAPINGLENFLTELKDAGIKMAMASSATMQDIDFILNKIPVRDDFEAIIDGSRVSKGKPNPQIFLKAAAGLNAKPEECVVFEDSLAGIQAANAAGMKVVAITTSHPAAELQHVNLVINDYAGLTVQMLADLF